MSSHVSFSRVETAKKKKKKKAIHYSDITWASWRLKSPATQLFVQPLVFFDVNQNIKALSEWPFVQGIHQCHDVIIHALSSGVL